MKCPQARLSDPAVALLSGAAIQQSNANGEWLLRLPRRLEHERKADPTNASVSWSRGRVCVEMWLFSGIFCQLRLKERKSAGRSINYNQRKIALESVQSTVLWCSGSFSCRCRVAPVSLHLQQSVGVFWWFAFQFAYIPHAHLHPSPHSALSHH